jgi:hypothetical protein
MMKRLLILVSVLTFLGTAAFASRMIRTVGLVRIRSS